MLFKNRKSFKTQHQIVPSWLDLDRWNETTCLFTQWLFFLIFKFHTYYHLKVIQFYTLNYNVTFSLFTRFYSNSLNSNTLVAHFHSIFHTQTSLQVTNLTTEMYVATSPTSNEGHALLTICLSVQEYRVYLEVSEARIYWPC